MKKSLHAHLLSMVFKMSNTWFGQSTQLYIEYNFFAHPFLRYIVLSLEKINLYFPYKHCLIKLELIDIYILCITTTKN